MTSASIHEWNDPEYVARWVKQDAQRDLLELPRHVSAALVADSMAEVKHVVDLGSGPGRYLEVFLDAFPRASGTWIDNSEPMLDEAKESLARFGERVSYIIGDAVEPEDQWLGGSASVILTSRMVHHLSGEATRSLYSWAFDSLEPGGWFFNLDHVGSPDDWETKYRAIKSQFTGRPRRSTKKPSHRHDHPFAVLGDHLEWLRGAGFEVPDVSWKLFFSALLSARRSGN